MAILITTLLALLLCYLVFMNYSKGTIIIYLTTVYIIPGYANVIGGIRFKFVVLGAIIISYLINHVKMGSNPLMRCAFFYLIYGLVLAILATYVPFSVQLAFLIKQWIYIFSFGLLLWPALKTEKEISYFLNIYYVLMFVSTCMGIFEYISSYNVFRSFFGTDMEVLYFSDDRLGMSGRICVATANPLDWGQCIIILFAMSLALYEKVLSKKKIAFLLILLSINCLLAGSRSSIFPLVVLVGLIFISKMSGDLKKHKWGIIMAFLIFVTFSYNISPRMKQYVAAVMMPWNSEASKDADMGGSSVELRETQLENSLYFIGSENLFVGMGYGLVHNRPEDDGDLFENAHGLESVVFVTVIEQGVIGLFCFFFLYVLLYRSTVKYSSEKKSRFLLLSLFICYMFSILLTGVRSSLQLFYTMLVVFARYEYLHNYQYNYRRL